MITKVKFHLQYRHDKVPAWQLSVLHTTKLQSHEDFC